MANTYRQIHIQAVFAVQNRDCIIQGDWKDELYKYITGIVQNNKHKMLAINGMPDHVQSFHGRRDMALFHTVSDLPNVIQYIKNQEEHHKKRSFIEEYEDLLKEFEIDYDERFVFKPIDYIVLTALGENSLFAFYQYCVPKGTWLSGLNRIRNQ
jgi:putative transposase